MRNLKTIENRVLAVLKEHPEARNDDMKLYLLVSKACIYDTHGISHFSFEDVMSNYKAFGAVFCGRYGTHLRQLQRC